MPWSQKYEVYNTICKTFCCALINFSPTNHGACRPVSHQLIPVRIYMAFLMCQTILLQDQGFTPTMTAGICLYSIELQGTLRHHGEE